jgi:hypothetical protein
MGCQTEVLAWSANHFQGALRGFSGSRFEDAGHRVVGSCPVGFGVTRVGGVVETGGAVESSTGKQ